MSSKNRKQTEPDDTGAKVPLRKRRLGNAPQNYRLSTHKLKKLQGNRTDQEFADDLGVSKNTVVRWTDTSAPSVGVQRKKAHALANSLDKTLMELLYNDPLPDQPQFYLDLSYGWFLDNIQDNDPLDSKKPSWFSESVRLESRESGPTADRRLRFSGTIKNCTGNTFDIEAERVSDFVFCMMARNESHSLSFVGIASKHLIKGNVNVLIGVWSGIDSVGHTAIFRWMLSNRILAKLELESIVAEYRISLYTDSDRFHPCFQNKNGPDSLL